MSAFCHDRDLLITEPGLFTGGAFAAQRLGAGADGVLTGTAFTSPSAEFFAWGVQPGMVLCLYTDQVSEGRCYEITAVPAAGTLSVSVVRATPDAAALPPPPWAAPVHWQVLSFAPQIAQASNALAERLRTAGEAAGIVPESFADSDQLRTVAAHATLAALFAASAEGAEKSDARWSKARHYWRLCQEGLLRLRLAVDVNGDGLAEQTRSLANVRLRRL